MECGLRRNNSAKIISVTGKIKISSAARITVMPSTPCIIDRTANALSKLGSSVAFASRKMPINKSTTPNKKSPPTPTDVPILKKLSRFCARVDSEDNALVTSNSRVLTQRILMATMMNINKSIWLTFHRSFNIVLSFR